MDRRDEKSLDWIKNTSKVCQHPCLSFLGRTIASRAREQGCDRRSRIVIEDNPVCQGSRYNPEVTRMLVGPRDIM